jgi:hypothetical protein
MTSKSASERRRRQRRREEAGRSLPTGALSSWNPDAGPVPVHLLEAAGAAGITAAANEGSGGRGHELKAGSLEIAASFWAFLQAHPEMQSHDKLQFIETYVAWRDDPASGAYSQPQAKRNPATIMRLLKQTLRVIDVRAGGVVVYRRTSPRSAAAVASATVVAEGVPVPPPPLAELPPPCMDYAAVPVLVEGVEDADTRNVLKLVRDFRARAGGAVQAIAVDMEFDREQIVLVQIAAPPSHVFLFDVLRCPDVVNKYLKPLLMLDDVYKVLHDCRQDQANLREQFGFDLKRVFDTSAADTVLRGVAAHQRRGLNAVLRDYTSTDAGNSQKEFVDHSRWSMRPLSPAMLAYAAMDVLFLVDAFVAMRERLQQCPGCMREAELRTQDNLAQFTTGDVAAERARLARSRERAALDRMVSDTAEAFGAHLQAEVDPAERRACEGSAHGFKEYFDYWKASELEAAPPRAWRGGAEAVRLKLRAAGVLQFRTEQSGAAGGGGAAAAAEAVHRRRAQIEEDKGGIRVSTLRALAPLIQRGERGSGVYRLHNAGRQARRLRAVAAVPAGAIFELSLPSAVQLPLELGPGEMVDMEILCTPRAVGVSRCVVSMQFDAIVHSPHRDDGGGGEGELRRWTIGRYVELRCATDTQLATQLQPVAPYQRRKRRRRRQRGGRAGVIPGVGLEMGCVGRSSFRPVCDSYLPIGRLFLSSKQLRLEMLRQVAPSVAEQTAKQRDAPGLEAAVGPGRGRRMASAHTGDALHAVRAPCAPPTHLRSPHLYMLYMMCNAHARVRHEPGTTHCSSSGCCGWRRSSCKLTFWSSRWRVRHSSWWRPRRPEG